MLDMVRSNGSRLKAKSRVALSSAIALSLTLGLTSCNQVDSIRPEVNRDLQMIMSPDLFESGYTLEDQLGVDSSTDGGTPGSEIPGVGPVGGSTEVPDVELSKFSPIPYNVVSSSSYSEYLKQAVETPVKEALKSLDSDKYSKVYFKCYHFGYNAPDDSSDGALLKSATYNATWGGLRNVGGHVVPDFLYDYLIKRYSNYVLKDRAVTRLQSSVSGVTSSMVYDEARVDDNVPSGLVAMWGSELNSSNASTLREFLNRADSYPQWCIPNLKLCVISGSSGTSEIEFNSVGGYSSRAPYRPFITTTQISRVLNSTNQLDGIEGDVKLECNTSDDHSICWGYIDNYSVTVILLGCDSSSTLRTVLGNTVYSTTMDAISSTYSWSEVDQIKRVLGSEKNPIVIESGLRR